MPPALITALFIPWTPLLNVMLPPAVTVAPSTIPCTITSPLALTENPASTLPLTIISPLYSISPVELSISTSSSTLETKTLSFSSITWPFTCDISCLPSSDIRRLRPNLNTICLTLSGLTFFPKMSVPASPISSGWSTATTSPRFTWLTFSSEWKSTVPSSFIFGLGLSSLLNLYSIYPSFPFLGSLPTAMT